jgi:hypothetical protein
MNIQNNDITPETFQYYAQHPIANKLDRLTDDTILLCTKEPVPVPNS